MSEIPNIFLDTTSIYNDPFFKDYFNGLLIELANGSQVNIFMSSVVFEEVKHNFEINARDRFSKFKKASNDLNKFNSIELTFDVKKAEDLKLELLDHYDELFSSGLLKLVEYNNSFLPEIVNRSIKSIKPFSRNKQEFKDCIIWLSYAELIKDNNLKNCFFISNNTKDFYTESKDELHEDLRNDIPNLKIYKNAKDLILSETELLELKAGSDLENWIIRKTVIENEGIVESIYDDSNQDIFNSIEYYVNSLEPDKIIGTNVNFHFLSSGMADDFEVEDTKSKIIENAGLITSIVRFWTSALVIQNTPVLGNDKGNRIEPREVIFTLKAKINFTIKHNETLKFYDIEDFNILKVE